MASVLCVGIATLDYVYAVPDLPNEGTKYRATALEVVGGGIAANAAVAVARLGGKASLLARLGDDVPGQVIRDGLISDHVDMGLAPAVNGFRSPVSAIMVDAAGERMIVSYSDPEMPLQPEWLPREVPLATRAVLGDTRWEDGSLCLFQAARKAGIPAILDADRKPADPSLLAAASHIAFSELGLAEQTGLTDPAAALHSYPAGHIWLAVTAGERGVWVRNRGAISHVPAFQVDVVDTLGAGDVWHGAFALALAEVQAEIDAVRFANAAAAIKCTRFGGRKGAPSRAEVEQFLKERT